MPESLTVLGIESSCDETAVAILRSAGEEKAPEILSSVISSQIAIHRQHGGVVPELASRNHSADLPGIIRTACREAGTAPADIDVFGATGGPGLVAALLVGNSTAKALALAAGRPFVSVNHLEGHLNIGNICRHTCNKTGNRKLIDIGKGKLLYLIIDILTQVLGKTGRSLCCKFS